jgi:hypothetical protein
MNAAAMAKQLENKKVAKKAIGFTQCGWPIVFATTRRIFVC